MQNEDAKRVRRATVAEANPVPVTTHAPVSAAPIAIPVAVAPPVAFATSPPAVESEEEVSVDG